MIYSEYFNNLTPIEIRLFEEGYWEFHPPTINDDGIIFRTYKWNALISYLHNKNKIIKHTVNSFGHDLYHIHFDMFTEHDILKCLNNSELFADEISYHTTNSYTKKDGTISIYNKKQKRKRK